MVSPPLERVVREEPMVVAALALRRHALFLAGLFFNLAAAAALRRPLAWRGAPQSSRSMDCSR